MTLRHFSVWPIVLAVVLVALGLTYATTDGLTESILVLPIVLGLAGGLLVAAFVTSSRSLLIVGASLAIFLFLYRSIVIAVDANAPTGTRIVGPLLFTLLAYETAALVAHTLALQGGSPHDAGRQ